MAIPPVTLNLLQLLPGDDQSIHTDKINYNFDQVISLGGGPPGLPGVIGIQGVPGSQGLQGFMGNPGVPGSKWFVQGTTPLVSPSPNIGDYWFNTDTLDVSVWDGITWVNIGTLTIAGVFKEATGDTDRIIFTNPTPLKSVVISPIDYGVGAPPGGAYKLKLIGTSGSNIQNFGVIESGGIENPSGLQSYITASIITPNTTYGLGFINPAGPIEVNALGTTLKLVAQSAGISDYEFNGLSLKIQIDPTERNLGFSAVAGSGLGFHIGLQDAVVTPTSRGLSIIDHADGFKLSLRGAHSDPLGTDVTNFADGVFLDSLNPRVNDIAIGSEQLWSRFRSKISAFNTAFLNIQAERTFDDPGNGVNPWRSAQVSLSMGIDASDWHSLQFTGGAKDSTQGSRPQLRFKSFLTGIHTTIDQNGRWGFGQENFIVDNNSTTDAEKTFATNINIQGPNTGTQEGDSIFSGIHFIPEASSAVSDRRMGITAGLFHATEGSAEQNTHAGVLFTREFSGTGMGIRLATGLNGPSIGGSTPGARTRISVESNGWINFHGRSNRSQTANREYRLQFNLDPNSQGIGFINGWDGLAHGGLSMQKDIIIQSEQSLFTDSNDSNFRGGGNLGIGRMTDFLGNKPQTKLHVFGAVTFGGREEIGAYEVDVAPTQWFNNWTFGFDHYSNGHNNITLGGSGTRILDPANDVVVIGSVNGQAAIIDNALQNNMVIIPSYSYQTTENWKAISAIPDPRKGGIFTTGYTETAGSDFETKFTVNTPAVDTVNRIAFLRERNNPGTNASNGLDIVSHLNVTGFPAGPPSVNNFDPPSPLGYYLHCIDHTFVNVGSLRTEKTIFLIDGAGKVGIGQVPKYRPNDSNYSPLNPATWPALGTAPTSSPSARWTDNPQSTLQISGLNGTPGGSILLNGGSRAFNAPISVKWDQIRFRTSRNNYDAGFNATSSSRIETPNIAKADYIGHAGMTFIVEPGLVYSTPTGTTSNTRVHGSTTVIKGGDAGIHIPNPGVVRGGDVIIHGGEAWDSNDKSSNVPTTLNNNSAADSGYGNVSLAYDWNKGQTAGAVSIGVGSPIQTMYSGRIRFTKFTLSSGIVEIVDGGKDLLGNKITVTGTGFAGGAATAEFTFPYVPGVFDSRLPTSNIAILCSIDSTSNTHWEWVSISYARTQATFNIRCTRELVGLWAVGPIYVSFVVYCYAD